MKVLTKRSGDLDLGHVIDKMKQLMSRRTIFQADCFITGINNRHLTVPLPV